MPLATIGLVVAAVIVILYNTIKILQGGIHRNVTRPFALGRQTTRQNQFGHAETGRPDKEDEQHKHDVDGGRHLDVERMGAVCER